MRLFLALFAATLTIPVDAASPSVTGITVDFELRQGTKPDLIIKITNGTRLDHRFYAPDQRQALQFVVMDESGTVIAPQGVAKVDPRQRMLAVKVGETVEFSLPDHLLIPELFDTVSEDAERRPPTKLPAAKSKKLAFPSLTGTGLFAHMLTVGAKYRVVAIYRPFGITGSGVCSQEHLIEILAGIVKYKPISNVGRTEERQRRCSGSALLPELRR